MVDERLRQLVTELNEAENEHLNEEGALKTRLHKAVVALCDYVGIENDWDTSDK